MALEIVLTVLSIIASLVIVFLFIGLGWYIVWKVFLSRFKFVRELLGTNGNSGEELNIDRKPKRPRRSRVD